MVAANVPLFTWMGAFAVFGGALTKLPSGNFVVRTAPTLAGAGCIFMVPVP